jgi:hypothetical protein
MTDNTIGICSDCKAEFKPNDPHIGYLCGQPVTVKARNDKEKDWIDKCRGVVIRHTKEGK